MLPKIEELRNIPKLSNAAVIGIRQSKLDDPVLSSEIHIVNYNTLCCDWNIHGWGVVCYTRNGLSYDVKYFLEKRLNDSTGKPKELRKALKSLDLPVRHQSVAQLLLK